MKEAGSKRDPDSIDTLVGRRIRERRRHLGISQVQLAATLELSYQQLQKYEQGSNQVAAARLAAISAALDVPPGYFFVTGVPDYSPQAIEHASLAAAQSASEAASELVRVTREGMRVPVDGVLTRLLNAARVVAELESRPQEAELLVAIHRWNAEQAGARKEPQPA